MTKRPLNIISILLAFLALAGCSQDETLSQSGGMLLLTRSGDGTDGSSNSLSPSADYRLLVFDNSTGSQIKNEAFTPGSSRLALEDGTYDIITLGNMDANALTISDPTLNAATVSCKENATIPMLYHGKGTLTINNGSSTPDTYTAQLEPVAGTIRLEVTEDQPGRYTYTLNNMYASISLSDGKGTGATKKRSLTNRQTVNSFPTDGTIILGYTMDGEAENTFDTGIALEAGKVTTLYLTVEKGEVELTGSEISAWEDGGTITDEVTTSHLRQKSIKFK